MYSWSVKKYTFCLFITLLISEMENFTNEQILLRYPPCLRNNIQELWMYGQIGRYNYYKSIRCMLLLN